MQLSRANSPAAQLTDSFAAPHLEPLEDLLQAISDALDVRDVFPRVAQMARRLLPHDGLALAVYHEDGTVAFQARSTREFADDWVTVANSSREPWLVRDTRIHDAADVRAPVLQGLASAGFRSLLCLRTMARDQPVRLGLFSKAADAYTAGDVPCAQRIADVIAVAVSHQQLAELQGVRAGTRARNHRQDEQVRPVMNGIQRATDPSKTVGESPEWRQVLRQAAQVALAETTVFVQGESGTGKEVLARFIHRASPRKSGPFVAINCAALPEQLLESELFGYERGAFTGANQAKAGQIELASGGVLFLDEVSEMSPAGQAKLLRVLQEREFQRLGGTRIIKANVRVVAASNRDLSRAVAEGTFREDLYYRLQVFDIRIPPLRERRSDIPLLAAAFLQEFNRAAGCSSAGLTPEAIAVLMQYDWPGNVRQLHNALERAAVLCQGGLIVPEHFALRSDSLAAPRTALPDVERRTIEQVLRETDGNKSKAARRLGITRTQLYGRLRKYDLDGM